MLRWPSLLVGLALMAVGLAFLGPFLLAGLRYEVVEGRLRGIDEEPLEDRQVRLVFRFAYPVDDPGPGFYNADVEALGVGRCDRSGRPLPPLVLDAAAANHLRARFNDQDGDDEIHRPRYVYYDPEDPYSSARICLEASIWRFELGLMMLITPPLAWLGFAIAAAGARRSVKTVGRRANRS